LREIVKERALEEQDPYEATVARARVVDLERIDDYREVIEVASRRLAEHLPYDAESLATMFVAGTHIGATSVSHGAALPASSTRATSRVASARAAVSHGRV
jgi:hypothetical protein